MEMPTVVYIGHAYSFRWYAKGYATINTIDGSTDDVAFLQGDEAYNLYAEVQNTPQSNLDNLLVQYDY